MAIFPTVWKAGHQEAVFGTFLTPRGQCLVIYGSWNFWPKEWDKSDHLQNQKAAATISTSGPRMILWAGIQVSGSSGTGYVDSELCHTVRIALAKWTSWTLTPMKLVMDSWPLPWAIPCSHGAFASRIWKEQLSSLYRNPVRQTSWECARVNEPKTHQEPQLPVSLSNVFKLFRFFCKGRSRKRVEWRLRVNPLYY